MVYSTDGHLGCFPFAPQQTTGASLCLPGPGLSQGQCSLLLGRVSSQWPELTTLLELEVPCQCERHQSSLWPPIQKSL